MNACADRWLQTVKQERLDHFLICGVRHLAHLVREFVEHYNGERLHQSLGYRTPAEVYGAGAKRA